ncbi:tetratricopeptide repeat protein [Colwellia sp. 75C3]|uniref:tetratricopeptide repeat protein n=1 Tax=Colwellia sp. 75C3 TaxID=888425 RepID=UPI001E514002|nr:tetratricopeptide repeat protein [Colwellia sp. 75C3]
MIFISSSSFFLPAYLTKQINDNNYSDGQFSFALKNHYVAALKIEENKAVLGSINWITLNRELAKSQSESALKLGYWYQGIVTNEKLDALNSNAIMWFEQAIRLHSQQAVVDLAQLYFQQGEIVKAQSTLRQSSELLLSNRIGESVLALRIKIAIHLGDTSLIKQLSNSDVLKGSLHSTTLSLIADMDKYAIVKNSSIRNDFADVKLANSVGGPLSCITSLQLFATNLKHLKHLEVLINTFNKQQPLAQYVCLSTPRYISIKQLDCEAQSQKTMTCDETRWQDIAEEVDSRHIGLMLNEGGANVHLGILYFDVKDSADVFSHEVSHLLGFVDEYPLTQDHDNCQGIQSSPFSHNIAVLKNHYQGDKNKLRAMLLKNVSWANSINENTPILQSMDNQTSKKKKWRLGTPLEYKDQIGIHISESCQKSSSDNNASSSYSAFKPLSRRTQLRYFAEDFPEEYLTLIKKNPSGYLMPSFHYNIALALYQQGEVVEAKYWLNKAAQWEDNPLKKTIVIRGGL